MKRTIPALVLAAACAGDPAGVGDDDQPMVDSAQAMTMSAACTNESRIQSSSGGGTYLSVQYRAESVSGLAPEDLWRVTATACDEVVEPADQCPAGYTCTGTPPVPKCAGVLPAIRTDGTLVAYCGFMQETRDAGGAVTSYTRRKFTTVNFRIE